MSFRFQKRVRVAPGVRLNFSKRRVSSSIGRRGATVTVGRRGIYGNTGVPGSGLSYRTRLDKASSNRKSATSSKQTGRTQHSKGQQSLTIDWNSNENDFIFFTEDGRPLSALEEKEVRRTYKNDLGKMYHDKAREINIQTERLLDLHHQLFSAEDNLYELAEESVTSNVPEPSSKQIYNETYTMNKNKLNIIQKVKLFLPSPKKAFVKEVETLSNNIYTKELRNFEREQTAISDEKLYRKELVKKTLEGDTAAMEDWVSLFLDELDFPIETDVDFNITTSDEIYIDIDLPTIDEIPLNKAKILKTGRLKVETKTQREQRENYAILVGGTALNLASFFFKYLPTIKRTVVSGYNQIKDDSTGYDVDQYIYSIILERDKLFSMNMEHVHPIKAFEHFNPRINTTKTYIFKEITPYEPKEK
ncbi:DUF4236 domain-containing protein [Evansella sp. AB-P1]|uniref:DUF4236 domain-containing protein n=1 Tax=Evansella sp. AB-P1 TaxID=3037653 RepID=UPI00241DE4BD|nr:DUF4236 domain-containing protein [Evansella sp. AB-P1]MDG5787719.1 DUF4236 domain-containing protein [Evansella sp. AB-P1]